MINSLSADLFCAKVPPLISIFTHFGFAIIDVHIPDYLSVELHDSGRFENTVDCKYI